mgnify:CR=1 FL=1
MTMGGIIFFIDARDGTGGGRVGGRMSRASMKKTKMSIRSGGGWLGLAVLVQKSDFWKVLGLARNPSKKMRLDESFRMVQSACHLVAYIKSYGQKTKIIARRQVAYFRNCNRWLCDASRCNY